MARPPITRARPYTPASGSLGGRTFTSERQYRNALARLKGFGSWRAQQRAQQDIRGARQWAALRPAAKAARDRALEALSLMRREGLSLTRAAAQAGTTPNTAWRYAGCALQRRLDGRIVATEADRLYRQMRLITPEGVVNVGIRGSRTASRVGDYWNAVHQYLATGDDTALRPFAGKRVAGRGFETNLDALDRWARRGELDFEDIYALTR